MEKLLMKLTWILLLGLAVAATCCSKTPDFSVEGEVGRAIYITMGLRDVTTAPIEYRVKVTIHNTGSNPLVWDQIQADFYPERGRHLTQSTFAYDPEKGEDRRAYYEGGNRPQEIAPGASHDLEVDTNGHTFDLLGEAGGKPLRFSVAVLLKGRTIAGPYVALLPPLDDLPSYEQALVGGGQKPVKLAFAR